MAETIASRVSWSVMRRTVAHCTDVCHGRPMRDTFTSPAPRVPGDPPETGRELWTFYTVASPPFDTFEAICAAAERASWSPMAHWVAAEATR